jgi:hypothetical protein
MNIFVVDLNPIQAARDLADKHVVKMVVEGCQMLSTVHRLSTSHIFYAPVELYKQSFVNHPCTIWTRQTTSNYMWLAQHTHELSNEYTRRYGRIHKAHDMTRWFITFKPSISQVPIGHLTPFAQAMPDKYKNSDAVQAYRDYYIHEKSRFAKWKFTEPPEWYTQGVNNVQMQVL